MNLAALSLYRQIMRLHRVKLPPEMRQLGDSYLRQEFRAHRKAKQHEFDQFMAQWHEYKQHLELEADLTGLGRDLADGTVESLSDDQKLQLDKLRDSAHRVAAAGASADDAESAPEQR